MNILLHEIKVQNLLSFGPQGATLELRPLNVLIGPNGSGKSNVLEIISLLRAAPTELAAPMRSGGGGIRDWIWQGKPGSHADLEVVVECRPGRQTLRHAIQFAEVSQRFALLDERIEAAQPEEGQTKPACFYDFRYGNPVLWAKEGDERSPAHWSPVSEERHRSIIALRVDPERYPETTCLARAYQSIKLFREWSFGPDNAARSPQKADRPNEFLEEDCGNLGLVLNRLRRTTNTKQDILDHLRQLYCGIDDYEFSVEEGTLQLLFQESGFTIPATRLSDGTLRYLCLLAVLCDPKPPPLVCLEEPELGMHPDIIPTIARLLRRAAERTQLIVTTHSDLLIDELTGDPESVVVCEKSDGQTSLRRLDGDALKDWLTKYRLGQLWTQGEIGGVRW